MSERANLDAAKKGFGSCNKVESVPTGSSSIASKHSESMLPVTSTEKLSSDETEGNSKDMVEKNGFDICIDKKSKGVGTLNPSLFNINRAKRNREAIRHKCLRHGMVLLKQYISHQDQVQIVKRCRELGIGEGGFYKPGYEDGAQLRLYMMCLGKNWNPQSRKYEDKRSVDGSTPPRIPEEFKNLVSRAILAAHDVMNQESGSRSIEAELPQMSPDICIANFYPNSGKLGLHQDRDESEESIRAGLPVVSFSIGDSADFFYGDERDEKTAEKVELESGDVLIFGGKSRRIFHGVPCIKKETAPKQLISETNLKSGRLNLTFRQH